MEGFFRKIRQSIIGLGSILALVLLTLLAQALFQERYTLPGSLQGLGIASYIDREDDQILSVHYPVTDNRAVNRQIEEMVSGFLDEFEADLAALPAETPQKELNISYDIARYNQAVVSVKFYVYTDLGNDAPTEQIHTAVFNLTDGRRYALADLLHQGGEAVLYDAIQEQTELTVSVLNGTAPLNAQFTLSAREMTLLFEEETSVLEVPVSLEKLGGVLNTREIGEGEELPTVSPGRMPTRNYASLAPDPEKPKVALTFDDGPNGQNTLRLLEELEKRGVRATFFVLGNRVEHNPEIVSRISYGGHELGNHGYNHRDMKTMQKTEVIEQFEKTDAAVREATGKETTCIRPPYGNVADSVLTYAEENRAPVILWSIDTLDWKSTDVKTIAEKAVANVKDGDIILLHDAFSSSVDAAIEIVDLLREQGYEFLTASELIAYHHGGIQPGAVYQRLETP